MPATITFAPAFPALPALDRPTNMVELPGQGRFLVTLQDGRLVSFPADPTANTLTTVLDWQDHTSRSGNEEGLLGLALDPAFSSNGYLYLYYSARPGERRTVLSRFATSGQAAAFHVDPTSELVLLSIPQPYSNHKGGQIGFGPDGMLYLGLGDGGSQGDPSGNGQDLAHNLLGSVLRLDVRGATAAAPYAIPPDNPFAGRSDGTKRETWAYGLRNPWRFSWDRATGRLWIGDVGQGTWEEIDLVNAGGNYGWNVMEGSHCYRPAKDCPQAGLTLPVAEYSHDDGGCSVTGGYVYRGQAVPELRGVYVFGDYCTGAIWGLRAEAAERGEVVEAKRYHGQGPGMSSFAEDAAGELYMLSFDGKIYRAVP